MSGDIPDTAAILAQVGFDADTQILTRRQAEVLCLRDRGFSQAEIAEWLGTSRANVSSIESSARENIEKARETIAFAEALYAPVQVSIDGGTDLYELPPAVLSACDEAGVKVGYSAPDLLKHIADAAGDAVDEQTVHRDLLIGVTHDGQVRVRSPNR